MLWPRLAVPTIFHTFQRSKVAAPRWSVRERSLDGKSHHGAGLSRDRNDNFGFPGGQAGTTALTW